LTHQEIRESKKPAPGQEIDYVSKSLVPRESGKYRLADASKRSLRRKSRGLIPLLFSGEHKG